MAENVAREGRQLEYYPGFVKYPNVQNIRILTVDQFLQEMRRQGPQKSAGPSGVRWDTAAPMPTCHWWRLPDHTCGPSSGTEAQGAHVGPPGKS